MQVIVRRRQTETAVAYLYERLSSKSTDGQMIADKVATYLPRYTVTLLIPSPTNFIFDQYWSILNIIIIINIMRLECI